jgi:hypothetical protein
MPAFLKKSFNLRGIMTLFLRFLMICGLSVSAFAHASYTGYSGAPSRGTCAGSCHGGGGGTVTISGFPNSYSPGQSYSVTIQRTSGSSISNFNGSCRIGTGSNNAGVLSSGTGTSTYNVTGETNGVHLSSNNQNSATFNWAAPVAGAGTVRLYVAAHQGNYSGANTVLVVVSDEASGLPGAASNPSPANNAQNVALNVMLSWTAGANAESHDVYFGANNPPPLIGNQTAVSYDPPGDLAAGMTYYWHVDEHNAAGTTPGPLWQFTTGTPPPVPSHLTIHTQANNMVLRWQAVPGVTLYNIYRDSTSNAQTIPANLLGSTAATTYTDAGVINSPALTYFYVVTSVGP